jgi:hypothetical protein
MSKDITYTVQAKFVSCHDISHSKIFHKAHDYLRMYKYGAGYTERRTLLSESTTNRLYDTVLGVRINIIQVYGCSV